MCSYDRVEVYNSYSLADDVLFEDYSEITVLQFHDTPMLEGDCVACSLLTPFASTITNGKIRAEIWNSNGKVLPVVVVLTGVLYCLTDVLFLILIDWCDVIARDC